MKYYEIAKFKCDNTFRPEDFKGSLNIKLTSHVPEVWEVTGEVEEVDKYLEMVNNNVTVTKRSYESELIFKA